MPPKPKLHLDYQIPVTWVASGIFVILCFLLTQYMRLNTLQDSLQVGVAERIAIRARLDSEETARNDQREQLGRIDERLKVITLMLQSKLNLKDLPASQ